MAKKILAVDDEQDITKLVRMSLYEEGYEVITASNGREALEKAFFENPDLIILDVMMPEANGFEVLQKLRENKATAQTPVIMLTAKVEEQSVAKGWKLGADIYLAKPFERSELIDCVDRIFTGETSAFPPAPDERNF